MVLSLVLTTEFLRGYICSFCILQIMLIQVLLNKIITYHLKLKFTTCNIKSLENLVLNVIF